jgi:hypothetical protein
VTLALLFQVLFFSVPVHYYSPGPVVFEFRLVPSAVCEGKTLTFISVPKPQKLPDQIDMAKIVLRVWLTYPFTRVILYATEAEYDPNHVVIPFVRETFGTDRLALAGNLPTGYEGDRKSTRLNSSHS